MLSTERPSHPTVSTAARRRRRTASTAISAPQSLPPRKRRSAVPAVTAFTSLRLVQFFALAIIFIQTAPVLSRRDSGPKAAGEPPKSTGKKPKQAQHSIRTDSTSYAHGDLITVTFSADVAATGDWAAIHPAGADPSALRTDPDAWRWSCGSRACLSYGTLAFDSGELDPGGSYRVHLILADAYSWQTQTYTASASSEVFFVESNSRASNISSGAPTDALTSTLSPKKIPRGIWIPTRIAAKIPTDVPAKSPAAPAPVSKETSVALAATKLRRDKPDERNTVTNVPPQVVRRRHLIKDAMIQLGGDVPWPPDVDSTIFLRSATENAILSLMRDDAAFHAVRSPAVMVDVQENSLVGSRFAFDATVLYLVDRTVSTEDLPGDDDVRRIVVAALGGTDSGYAESLRRWPAFVGADGATLYVPWAVGAAGGAVPAASLAYGDGILAGVGIAVAVALVAFGMLRRRDPSVAVGDVVLGNGDDGGGCWDNDISDLTSEITLASDEDLSPITQNDLKYIHN